MKKFQSREYDQIKECQTPKSKKVTKSKHPILKNFDQKADHNIEKSNKMEYRELPAEDVHPGEHKLPKDNIEEKKQIKKEDKKNAECELKFKKMVKCIKDRASECNIDSKIVKSLDEIDSNNITEEQYNIFEKSLFEMDHEGFALFVKMMKSGKTSEKAMSSAPGQGGDLIAPQMAGSSKKKLVKIKKSEKIKGFFVSPGQ